MKTTFIMKIILYFSLLWLSACQHNDIKPIPVTDHKHETKAFVLQKNEGEVLNDPRGRTVNIKVSPENGAAHLTMGTTEMPIGSNIVLHRHENAEEILFVHRGNGIALVNGDSIKISEGATLFIPPGAWHGVKNPGDSMNILFVVTPQGQEKVFRALAAPPGTWTAKQIDSIRKVVGTHLQPH